MTEAVFNLLVGMGELILIMAVSGMVVFFGMFVKHVIFKK